MTEGAVSPATAPYAPDAYDFLSAGVDLAGSASRMMMVIRMQFAEHKRLRQMTDRDVHYVLDEWRAALDLLDLVIPEFRRDAANASETLIALSRDDRDPLSAAQQN